MPKKQRGELANHPQYRKLYFVWYFDDDEGYGIEVFGEQNIEGVNGEAGSARFISIMNWSFGHGTPARDLRRAWGEYVAREAANKGGSIPADISRLRLRYDPVNKKMEGDLELIEKVMGENAAGISYSERE